VLPIEFGDRRFRQWTIGSGKSCGDAAAAAADENCKRFQFEISNLKLVCA
jgi:hypothetical protein